MKILLSPSKTQGRSVSFKTLPERDLYDPKKSLRLFNRLKKLSKEDLAQIMHLDGKLLDQTYLLYQTFDSRKSIRTPAICLYTGLVFNQLDFNNYDEEQWRYIDEHVRILSALYGIVHPFSAIWKYRLDYTMQFAKLDLRKLWSKGILATFRYEDLIIDLTSQEFGQTFVSLKKNRHQILFLDSVDGKEKIVSTNAKMARGKMANYLITQKITDITRLRQFNENGYLFQPDRSNDTLSVFLKQH